MPKAAPKPKAKAAPKPLTGWCALQASRATTATSASESGEKCLQMSWGPLRFVDSMNVFPTSLASMIDDLRACTHKQLPEPFPLMASLHPELQLRTPTDSPPQRRPLKTAADALRAGAGVGLHPAQAAHALRALLRRRGVGDARGVGGDCYDSVLAGKAVSAEDHRLAVSTANVMGRETFREFHDCYLHTDVLALADVMESYRDSFRAQSGLDPHPLRHAADSARETQAYRDVRASVMGGLSCIFQPFAQANNPELGEED